MREHLTDITLLLDRTGSMQVVRDETISAVNTFLVDQKKVPGEAHSPWSSSTSRIPSR